MAVEQVVMKVPQQVALTTLKGQVRAVVGVPITTKKHKITFPFQIWSKKVVKNVTNRQLPQQEALTAQIYSQVPLLKSPLWYFIQEDCLVSKITFIPHLRPRLPLLE